MLAYCWVAPECYLCLALRREVFGIIDIGGFAWQLYSLLVCAFDFSHSRRDSAYGSPECAVCFKSRRPHADLVVFSPFFVGPFQ